MSVEIWWDACGKYENVGQGNVGNKSGNCNEKQNLILFFHALNI